MVLHASRGSNGFGPSPIAVSELDAYCRFERIEDHHERRNLLCVVQMLDAEYFAHYSKQQERRRKK